MKIAIIGTGITGLSAAWALKDQHEVTVFEKEARLGGHSNTVTVDYDGKKLDEGEGGPAWLSLGKPCWATQSFNVRRVECARARPG